MIIFDAPQFSAPQPPCLCTPPRSTADSSIMSVFSYRSTLYLLETRDGPATCFDTESGKRLAGEDPRSDGLRLNMFNIPPMTQDDSYTAEGDDEVASHDTDGTLEVRRQPGHNGSDVVKLFRKADGAQTLGILVPCRDLDEEDDADSDHKKTAVAFLMNDANVPIPCGVSRSEWIILGDFEVGDEIKRDEGIIVLEHQEGYVYPSNGPKTDEDLLKIFKGEAGGLAGFADLGGILRPAYKHMTRHPEASGDFFAGDEVSFRLCKDGGQFTGRLCEDGSVSFRFHPFCAYQTKIAVDLLKKH